VVGVAAQLLLGWPWWLVAAGVVAAVWLFFASTALWGAGGSSQPLATDLLRVVRPHKAIERDHRQEVERFRAAPFPLYGLPPAWPGSRHLGGWEGRWAKGQRPVTTALSLGHGDPLAEAGSQLQVEVRAEGVEPELGMTMRVESRRHLAEDLWLQAAPPAHDPAQHLDQLAGVRLRPDPAWSMVTTPVDGRPVGFEWLAEGRHWVAQAELDDRTLTPDPARPRPAGRVGRVGPGLRPGALHPGSAPPAGGLGPPLRRAALAGHGPRRLERLATWRQRHTGPGSPRMDA
jgi:hypothetical protein